MLTPADVIGLLKTHDGQYDDDLGMHVSVRAGEDTAVVTFTGDDGQGEAFVVSVGY